MKPLFRLMGSCVILTSVLFLQFGAALSKVRAGLKTEHVLDGSLYGGGEIVFTSEQDSSPNARVYSINPDGTNFRQISDDIKCQRPFCISFHPVWSPDGKYVAFFIELDKTSGISINILNIASHQQHTLVTTHVAPYLTLSWAADSKSLAYVSNAEFEPDHAEKIYMINVDGTHNKRFLDLPNTFVTSPQWAPNGAHILFNLQNAQAVQWIISDPDGTHQRVINSDRTVLRWSPDSQTLAIGRSDSGSIDIVNANDGTIKLTLAIPSDTTLVSWSPDGQSLLLDSEPDADGNNQLYVVGLGDKAVHQITASPANYINASWSPNSKYIAVEATIENELIALGSDIYILVNIHNRDHPYIWGQNVYQNPSLPLYMAIASIVNVIYSVLTTEASRSSAIY